MSASLTFKNQLHLVSQSQSNIKLISIRTVVDYFDSPNMSQNSSNYNSSPGETNTNQGDARAKEISQMDFDAETARYVGRSDVRGIEAQLGRITKTVPSGKPIVSSSAASMSASGSIADSSSGGEPSAAMVPRFQIKSPPPRREGMTAFAFDIDGVLIRSKAPLPDARETLLFLQEHKVPFIFLTNGGGLTEADHAALMGQRLGLKFSEAQVVQSHTPFCDLVPILQHATILILGGVGHKNCKVAQAYGFKHVLTSSDIFRAEPDIYPFAELTELNHLAHGKGLQSIPRIADGRLKIDAIFVFSSPRDWGLDLQLVTDLLLSHNGILGTSSTKNGDPSLPNRGYQQDGQPGLYFCNPDLTWATKYSQPRLAQGSFASALEGIWASQTGGAELLNRFTCGKPTATTYEYAERVLLDYHFTLYDPHHPDVLQNQKIGTVYMIGDNPASDIAGANAFKSPTGVEWNSVLVESGVYEAGTVPAHEPTGIAKGVKEAVKWALKIEGRHDAHLESW